MSVPNSKGRDITVRIEALSKRLDVTPFEVKVLEREIDKLVAVDAAEAYMLGGMLAATTGKRDESKVLHEKSLRLLTGVVSYFNYGVSMKTVGNLTLANELFEKAAELVPGDSQVFKHRLQTLAFLLDYEEFETVVDKVKRSGPPFDVDELRPVIEAREFIRQVSDLGISLAQLKKVGLHLQHVLLQCDLNVSQILERISHFDGVSHVYVEASVDATDAKQLVDVNERLMDLILEDPSIDDWDRIVVNIVRRDYQQERLNLEHSAA